MPCTYATHDETHTHRFFHAVNPLALHSLPAVVELCVLMDLDSLASHASTPSHARTVGHAFKIHGQMKSDFTKLHKFVTKAESSTRVR